MDTTQLLPDFKDFLKLLNAHKVKYLLVGGYAVCIHGFPRTTGDIDFWVAVNQANAGKLTQVFRAFGFSEATEALFLRPGKMTRVGEPPVRIEVLTNLDGVDFQRCYAKRIKVDVDGVSANVIDLQSLLKNKIAAGRHKDLEDVAQLQRFQKIKKRKKLP